jgi:hypothetical protein
MTAARSASRPAPARPGRRVLVVADLEDLRGRNRPVAASAGGPVAGAIAALLAGVDEVEVLDHDRAGLVLAGGGQDGGDRGPQEPGLEDEDFSDAGRRLDRLSGKVFARYGLGPEDVAQLRKRFAAWPRS